MSLRPERRFNVSRGVGDTRTQLRTRIQDPEERSPHPTRPILRCYGFKCPARCNAGTHQPATRAAFAPVRFRRLTSHWGNTDVQTGRYEPGIPVSIQSKSGTGGFVSDDQEGGNWPTCQWAQSGDPNVKLSDTGAENPTFTTPTSLTQDTTLEFTLQVTDRGDLTDEDTVSVTILTGG